MRIMIKLFIVFFISNLTYANSADSCIPATIKIEGKNIILSGTKDPKQPQIYFFKNKSIYSVWVDRVMQDPGASAGWASYFRAGNWSALLLNKNNFTLTCFTVKPGTVVPLDCNQVISICKPKIISIPTTLKGSGWLVEDKSWDIVMNVIEKKGVKFQKN